MRLTRANIPTILSFLQNRLAKGLSTNTLKRQAVAISSILGAWSGASLATHPHVKYFLRSAALLNPLLFIGSLPGTSTRSLMPSCTLPLSPSSWCLLGCSPSTYSSWWSSPPPGGYRSLGHCQFTPRLCIVHKDRTVLLPDPSLTPKVNTLFHKSQGLILPNFCPKPTHSKKKLFHKLNVRRAVRLYHREQGPLKSQKLYSLPSRVPTPDAKPLPPP